jgi:Domain of unknown function (DUF4832)/Domain of unknown function (DUF4874)
MRHFTLFFLLFFLKPSFNAQTTTVNYPVSTAVIPNPDRGFYHFTSTFESSPTPLILANLIALRSGYSPSSGNYTTPVTLIYRGFYLDNSLNSDISVTSLTEMEADFVIARQAGVKVIARFAYSETTTLPYFEPSKTQILAHIAQLAPVFAAYSDVIATVQIGFIGAFGEGYYTQVFGDASIPPFSYTATNWQDRIDVVNALLNALPTNRKIQVRTPQTKQKVAFGVAAPTNSAATGGRIGHHNDCFLAPFNDYGTYNNYDNGADDTTALKPYLKADAALNVPIGGETCDPNSPHSLCFSGGGAADSELKRFRFSFLNADYNNLVNNTWTPCIDNINKNLGYRLRLTNGIFPNLATAGASIAVSFSIKNDGWAAVFNPRLVELILRNVANGNRFYATVTANPMTWAAGSTTTISQAFCLPSSMPAGNYELLLNLPDPASTLYSRADYAIQLANTGLWEAATGYNKMNHTIAVSGSVTGCSGFTAFSANNALPIELRSFSGKKGQNAVQLNWETVSESQLAFFEIERSMDGLIFDKIGQITAENKASTYQFLDNNLSNNSTIWYRLRVIDFDGSDAASRIVFVKISSEKRLHILGNPIIGNTLFYRIENSNLSTQLVDYQLIAADGRFIKNGKSSGEMDVENLPNGVYFLKIKVDGLVFFGKFLR